MSSQNTTKNEKTKSNAKQANVKNAGTKQTNTKPDNTKQTNTKTANTKQTSSRTGTKQTGSKPKKQPAANLIDDEEWFDIADDTWADDVPLMYSEDGWKPDEAELTFLSLDHDSKGQKSGTKTKKKKEYTEAELSEIIEKESKVKRKHKVKPFRLFMILWLGILSICIAFALGKFYDFLEEYENAYQASRSFHNMDDLIQVFRNRDIDALFNMMTSPPETNEFETDANIEHYMTQLMEDKFIDYTRTNNYSEDFPEYYVRADGYIVATVALRKDPTANNKYDFPSWYISEFNFYTDAQHSARVELPSNYTIYFNGIPVSTDYRYEGNIRINLQDYFTGYQLLPSYEKYYCDGFFDKPELTATSPFGSECPVVWNPDRGIYEVPFVEPENANEVKEFAMQFASDYANYISGDNADNSLDKYFEPNAEKLKMIKAGTSRKYFTPHSGTYIGDIVVDDFTMYNEKCAYAHVYLEQHMYVWGEDTTVKVRIGVCCIKTDTGWIVCNVRF